MTDDALLALYQFQSTLSLRRATVVRNGNKRSYPISIHALLAESDARGSTSQEWISLFQSTLSLRRATVVE